MPRKLEDGEVESPIRRIIWREALRLLDVVSPFLVEVDRIDAEADHLDASSVEFRLDFCHIAELSGADRREVLGEKITPQELPSQS
jgi:hypothetical protein